MINSTGAARFSLSLATLLWQSLVLAMCFSKGPTSLPALGLHFFLVSRCRALLLSTFLHVWVARCCRLTSLAHASNMPWKHTSLWCRMPPQKRCPKYTWQFCWHTVYSMTDRLVKHCMSPPLATQASSTVSILNKIMHARIERCKNYRFHEKQCPLLSIRAECEFRRTLTSSAAVVHGCPRGHSEPSWPCLLRSQWYCVHQRISYVLNYRDEKESRQ